jgi:hypothetical protein
MPKKHSYAVSCQSSRLELTGGHDSRPARTLRDLIRRPSGWRDLTSATFWT